MKIQLYKTLLKKINESTTTLNKDRLCVYAYILTNKYRYYDNYFSLTRNEMKTIFSHNAYMDYKTFFIENDLLETIKCFKGYKEIYYYNLTNVKEEIIEVNIKSSCAKKNYIKYNEKVFKRKYPRPFNPKAEIIEINYNKREIDSGIDNESTLLELNRKIDYNKKILNKLILIKENNPKRYDNFSGKLKENENVLYFNTNKLEIERMKWIKNHS